MDCGRGGSGVHVAEAMNDLVKGELTEVLTEWRAGKPVQSIMLGHPHEGSVFRQTLTHAFVFALIESELGNWPVTNFHLFDVKAEEKAQAIGLTQEERGAGTSLAWSALRRGWKRAISGFPDTHTITVKQSGQQWP